MSLFKKHKHTFIYPSGKEQKGLIVSGYGLTEYKLMFCINCGEIIWELTKDIENLYPKLKSRKATENLL